MRAHIRLISSDGNYFDIPEQVTNLFPAMATMINEEHEVVLTELNPIVLPLVIEWALKHLDDKFDSVLQGTILKFDSWDNEFIEELHPWDLMELLVASNYLGNIPLRNLAAKRLAVIIQENSAEENDTLFGSRAQELLELILSHHIE